MIDLPMLLKERYDLADQDIRSCPSLTLAYIGDAVYELILRTYYTIETFAHADKLNKRVSDLAKAGSQAETYRKIKDILTEDEQSVYKRGRNSKPHSIPKHAKISDYMSATGFEALIGYLYLTGQTERMMELINEGHKDIFNQGKET